MTKIPDFSQISGLTITGAEPWAQYDSSWLLHTSSGDFELIIEDDGYGGSDSHAYLNSVVALDTIIGSPIIGVSEAGNGSYGATIELTAATGKCVIEIQHEHNGFYEFSYQLVRKK